MKATREHCLRCGEPLAHARASAGAELSRWSTRQTLALGGVVVLFVLSAVVLSKRRAVESSEPVRTAASASSSASAQPSTPSVSSTAESSGAPAGSAMFIDSVRVGTAAFTTGNFESARAAYESALEKNPDDPDTLNNLGQALVRLKRVADAVPLFERAVALSPEKWAYRFNLAHAAGQLGQWDRAATDYREAVRLFPDDYATQFNLALALHKKGDYQAAIPEFQKAIELAPGEFSFHVALGNSLEAAGRIPEAVVAFRQYLELAPDAPDAVQLKAHVDALVAARAPAAPSRS